jgi:hypothetical protein
MEYEEPTTQNPDDDEECSIEMTDKDILKILKEKAGTDEKKPKKRMTRKLKEEMMKEIADEEKIDPYYLEKVLKKKKIRTRPISEKQKEILKRGRAKRQEVSKKIKEETKSEWKDLIKETLQHNLKIQEDQHDLRKDITAQRNENQKIIKSLKALIDKKPKPQPKEEEEIYEPPKQKYYF